LEMAGTRQNSPKKTKHWCKELHSVFIMQWCTGGCWFTLAPEIVVLTKKCSQTQKRALKFLPSLFFFWAFWHFLDSLWCSERIMNSFAFAWGPFVQIIVCFYVNVPCIISHTSPFRFRMCFQKTNAEI
jgi:hypothetical protein